MELLIILIIILILFGASRLPNAGKGLGKAIGNFKKAMSENKRTDVTKKEMSKEEKKGEK